MKRRKINDIYLNNKKRNIYICLLICFFVIFLSIGYSSYQNNLNIDNVIANVKIDKDIRIMGVSVNSVNNSISNYEDYNVSNITSNVNLDSSDSYVIYDVLIYNLGNIECAIGSISVNNDNLQVEVLDYNLGDKICEDDVCSLGVKKTIQVKVSYKDNSFDSTNTNYSIRVDFNFGAIYNVSYVGFSDTSSFPTTCVEGMDFVLNYSIDTSKNISITMNNKSLTSGNGYTYSDNVLKILNVDGDITITISDMTIMKEKIIASLVDSGSEEDITLYDLDTMSSSDKQSTFGSISTTSGLIRTKGINGSGNSIIFRGSIDNNYVSFGGNIWRILQIDEDGNLRLILNNTISTGAYNSTSSISSEDEVETVLGYANSSIKSTIDSWYTTNLSNYTEYIVKSKFCNDFTYETKTSTGASNSVRYYQSYLNVGSDAANYSPSLVCPSSSIISSDVGLISAEEVVLAGGAFNTANSSFYLYNSSGFWTLSPAYYDPTQANGGVFYVSSTGLLSDWSRSLLTATYGIRPVITIDGNLDLTGDGTLSNPYKLASEKTVTIAKYDVTDLASLENGEFYITNTGGTYNVDGLLSSTVSGIGLLGTNTATFSSDKSTIVSTTGTKFTFVNGEETTDGYLYEIKTIDGKYLTIGESDYSVTLSDTAVSLKVSLVTDSSYTGRIVISDSTGSMYLNFYGAENTADDKFAGWNQLDKNDYMILYKEVES